jgi:hypothetical protein
MANKNSTPSPVLALAPLEYDTQYMNSIVRLLNYFIEQQDNAGNMRGSDLAISVHDVKTNTYSAGTPTPIAATALVANTYYTIVQVGTTNFVAIGAVSNTVGVTFKATGSGAGTGRVIIGSPPGTVWRDTAADNTLKIIP